MKLSKTIFLSLTLSLGLCSSALSKEVTCPKFTQDQIDVMHKSYTLGEPHDMGYTLAAIALKESSAGEYVINAISRDFGIYQGNVETLCKQAGVFHNSFQCNMEIQNIVNDINLAAKHALITLNYWRDYHEKRSDSYLVYEKTVRSYNRGFSFADQGGTDYWEQFRKDFYTVKSCVSFT